MSNVAIDQILKITTAPSAGHEPARSNSVSDDRFSEHLDRASKISAPEQTPAKENDVKPAEEDQPLDTHTEQQETSTTEQEQTAAPSESSEPAKDNSENSSAADEATDEVTLSAAAAAAQPAEASAVAEQVVNTEIIVDATSTDNQQQSEGQPTPQTATFSVENSAESVQETAEAEAAELALLNDGTAEQTAATSEEQQADVEAKKAANAQAAAGNAEEIVEQVASANTAQAGSTQQTKSSSTSSTTQNSTTDQTGSIDVPPTLAEGDTEAGGDQHTPSRFETSTATTSPNELAAATDTELAAAQLDIAPEVASNSTRTSNPTAGNESAAIVGKSAGNLLAGKTAGTAAASTTETSVPETPTVDRARFVQRVGGAIRSAQQRDGQIQLRLSPPELGTLRIQLTVSEGSITARLETETSAARTVLLDNLPALRERLAEQEITIEKFDVDVGADDREAPDFSDAKERQDRRSSNQNTNATRRTNTQASAAVATSTPTQQSNTASGLDIRI